MHSRKTRAEHEAALIVAALAIFALTIWIGVAAAWQSERNNQTEIAQK